MYYTSLLKDKNTLGLLHLLKNANVVGGFEGLCVVVAIDVIIFSKEQESKVVGLCLAFCT